MHLAQTQGAIFVQFIILCVICIFLNGILLKEETKLQLQTRKNML